MDYRQMQHLQLKISPKMRNKNVRTSARMKHQEEKSHVTTPKYQELA